LSEKSKKKRNRGSFGAQNSSSSQKSLSGKNIVFSRLPPFKTIDDEK
jgi:hypothetical protein